MLVTQICSSDDNSQWMLCTQIVHMKSRSGDPSHEDCTLVNAGSSNHKCNLLHAKSCDMSSVFVYIHLQAKATPCQVEMEEIHKLVVQRFARFLCHRPEN